MRRFLTLAILIVFVIVSCAGPIPKKKAWIKPDFCNEEFEKDREKCIQSIDSSLDSQAFGNALEDCLAKEGYKYFRQDQFERDRKDCLNVAKNDPEQKITVENCLTQKGYELEPPLNKGLILLSLILAPLWIPLWALGVVFR